MLLEPTELKEAAVALARKREELTSNEYIRDDYRAMMEATKEGQDFKRWEKTCREIAVEVIEAKRRVYDLQRADFQATGIKKPLVGLEMKIERTISYSVEALLAWCLKKARMYVLLDTKAIGKIKTAMELQRAGAPIEIAESYAPTIAEDLSAYLVEETEDGEALEGPERADVQFVGPNREA